MVFLQSLIRSCVLKARLYYSYSRLYLGQFKWKTRRKLRSLNRKVRKINKSRRRTQRRTAKHASNAVLPLVPGISKLKLPEPPAPRLLLSNEVPTDDEVVAVKAVVQQVEKEKDRLRRRLILRLMSGESNRTWEAATRHKIGRTSVFIRQHKGAISPLRTLPSEILQEIFIQASSVDDKRSRSTRDIPWYLAQVCKRWRTSALSISSLWSHLPTIVLKKSKTKTARQFSSIQELIKRSGTAPLRFYVHTRKYNASFHPTLSLLMTHAERWQSAVFQIPHTIIHLLQPVKDRLPLLETLVVRARIGLEEEPLVMDMFAVAPQLRTVTLSGLSSTNHIVLPFTQLVNYTDRSSGIDLLFRILDPTNCVSLKTLTILEISEDLPFPAFTLPNLTKLVVREYNWHNISYFSQLILPSIEEIKFMSYGGQVLPTLVSILSNNTDGPCSLKTLIFRCESTGEDNAGALTQLLKLTPNLVHLDTSLPSYVDIQNLASGPGESENQMLVPLLKTCKFYVSQDWSFTKQDADALNALATSRCGAEGTKVVSSSQTDAPLVSLLPCETHSLDTLVLYCDFMNVMAPFKQQLNIGLPVADKDEPEWDALMEIKRRLREEIPDLLYLRRYKDKSWNPLRKERVGKILDELERMELKNLHLLYHSDLHNLLRPMGEWGSKHNEGSGSINRVRTILDKWTPDLERELIPNLKWASKGSHGIVYLSHDDPLRKSDQAKDIVFSLPELEYADIYWPTYMSWDPAIELIDFW